MEKQHFSVARVVTHTTENISKFERHDERKNTTYSNTNIVSKRTPMNIYFKRYNSTLNQKFDEMVKNGQISTRGLKANAKIYNELVFDVNSLYFEENGGYEFAKSFYEKAYNFAEKEMGTENILTAVLHADELNTALTEEFGKEIYHYHLHVIAIPVVLKEIKYSKRCKDKSLVGKTKEVIHQVSHSKKWKSLYDELAEKTKDYFHAIKLAPQRVADFFKSLFDKEKQDELERQRIAQKKIESERKSREEAKEKEILEKQKFKNSPEYKKRRADRDAR